MSENGGPVPAAAGAAGTTGPEVPLLEVTDLKTYYEVRRGLTERATRSAKLWVHAVDGVSFRLVRGEMMALVGESGCGKTTTAQTILGMVKPTDGAIRLNGTNIAELSERRLRPLRRTLQMIYQDPYESLDPRFRVRESVEEPMLVHGIGGSRAEREKLAVEALERAGLPRRGCSWTVTRMSCPAASGSGSPSPPRWYSALTCCSPTSRCRCSTSPSGPECCRCWTRCAATVRWGSS